MSEIVDARVRVAVSRWGFPQLGVYRFRIYTPDGKDQLTFWFLECFGFSIGGHTPSWLCHPVSDCERLSKEKT